MRNTFVSTHAPVILVDDRAAKLEVSNYVGLRVLHSLPKGSSVGNFLQVVSLQL